MSRSRQLFHKKPSLNFLLNQTPFDGCLLMFNAKRKSVNTKTSELGVLRCNKISSEPMSREVIQHETCDLYISWRDE